VLLSQIVYVAGLASLDAATATQIIYSASSVTEKTEPVQDLQCTPCQGPAQNWHAICSIEIVQYSIFLKIILLSALPKNAGYRPFPISPVIGKA
jgi:hypothetical protein